MRSLNRKTLLLSLLTTASLTSPAFAEVSNEELLAQMKAMQKEIAGLKSELAAVKQTAKAASTTAKIATRDAVSAKTLASKSPAAGASIKGADAQDIKVSFDPAPKFETADGAYSFKVGGFGQFDGSLFNDDRRDHPDGWQARRIRLNASGVIAKDWKYKIENDFGLGTSVVTDAFVEYTGFKPVTITIGQFKEPFSLDILTSDLFTTFNERASPTTVFAPDRQIGIAIGTSGKLNGESGEWSITAGGFGNNISTNSPDDESKDATARLVVAPWAEKDKVLHFGLAGSYRVPEASNDQMIFQSRAENRQQSSQSVAATVTGIDSTTLLGLEAAGVYGPAALQGEYIMADVDRRSGLTGGDLNGWYAEASYFLTGESKNYKGGKFERVKPKQNFSLKDGGWGAWMLAARYSDLDLNDGGIAGGHMKDTTFAVKWIPLPNIMFSANYIIAETDALSVTPNDDPRIFVFRTQFDF